MINRQPKWINPIYRQHSSAILGLVGLDLAFGRHGLIVYCGGMVRIVCTLASDWIFILIPLLRGFYFSKNTLSDVHTHRCLALRFWEEVDRVNVCTHFLIWLFLVSQPSFLGIEVEGIGVKKSYGPINNALYCRREKGMASDLRGLIHCLLLYFFCRCWYY